MELSAMADAVEREARRLTTLLRSVSAPDAAAIGHWTVRDTAVHLADVFSNYPGYIRGTAALFDDPMAITAHNEKVVGDGDERDLGALADRIDAGARDTVQLLRAGRADDEVRWHGGAVVRLSSLAAIPLTEALLHGYDIAGAEGRYWPIGRDVAAASLVGLGEFFPYYADPYESRRTRAIFELRLRGDGSMFMRSGDGRLEVSTSPMKPVDCRISADPATFLLVGYGRIAQWGPVVRGKIAAYGRRPWLALRLTRLLRVP